MPIPPASRSPDPVASAFSPHAGRRPGHRPSPAPRPRGAGWLDGARARLLRLDAEALTETELLAILLAPGGRTREVEARARRMLSLPRGLRGVAAARPGALVALPGIEAEVACRVAAAFALGRRVHAAPLEAGRLLRRSDEIYAAFGARLRDLQKERFIAVLLDGRSRVLREDVVSEGILTASLVHPREVFAPAIREAAATLLLVHNHPSGDPEPSPEDVEVTRRLCAVGELVGIRVVDHVVIGDGGYVSFLERGMMPPA